MRGFQLIIARISIVLGWFFLQQLQQVFCFVSIVCLFVFFRNRTVVLGGFTKVFIRNMSFFKRSYIQSAAKRIAQNVIKGTVQITKSKNRCVFVMYKKLSVQSMSSRFFLSFSKYAYKKHTLHNLRIVFQCTKKLIHFFFIFHSWSSNNSHSNLFQDHLWHGHCIF